MLAFQVHNHSKFGTLKVMRKILLSVALVLLFLVGARVMYHTNRSVYAVNPVEDLQKQIDELEKLKKMSEDATKPLEAELENLNSRIQSARNGIVSARNQSAQLAKDIESREEQLAVQYNILAKRIGEEYKRSRTYSPIMTFLATQDAAKLTKDLAYRSSVKAQDNRLIQSISGEIEQLESDKIKLEEDQVRLAALEKQLDSQAEFFRGEIKGAQAYQEELSGKIADLSARQQEIINSRSGTFTASIGNSELADDFKASIKGFRDSAPSGSFAVFSFGAYTHRKGMSQYGARGRAQAGQD